jgi:hypothetical protein
LMIFSVTIAYVSIAASFDARFPKGRAVWFV